MSSGLQVATAMATDFNAELHARPSIYFSAPALVEHFALMPFVGAGLAGAVSSAADPESPPNLKVEHHHEFVTVTRVSALAEQPERWPDLTFSQTDAERLAGLGGCRLICRVAMLVVGPAKAEYGALLRRFDLGDSAGSQIGGSAAQIFSDFQVRSDGSSRILVFNDDLNSYRLGRIARRLCEIETYRSMALLGLPDARALGPALVSYDADLVTLAGRNISGSSDANRKLLDDITQLSARVVSDAARTRHRFGATAAYAKIVEERIAELREERIPGYQRFGVFIDRRFNPAVRTCAASAVRLDQLSQAAMLLVDLLQTRIQVEVQLDSGRQIELMAERAAVQIKIQQAVEGLSIIAITYYLVAIAKSALDAIGHAGVEVDPRLALAIIPLILFGVILTIVRVRRALLGSHDQ